MIKTIAGSPRAMVLSLALLAPALVQASECSREPFTAPAEDQQRLDAGHVGQWNDTFTESLITVQDIDGNPWDYFALEKKPAEPESLVIFLHGFLEFAWAWEEQLEYFGDRYHAVALDLKGHHYSSNPDVIDEYNFLELAWEIRAIINCLGYSKATIVGHDFGGAIAWIMGMLHPDVVEGLVVSSVPHPYTFGRALLNPDSDQAHRSRYIGYAQGTSLVDQFNFTTFILSDTSIFDSGFYSGKRIFRLMEETWFPTRDWKMMKHYYRAMPYPALEQDYPETLTEFQKKVYSVKRPTLLLWGLADPYFALDSLDGIDDLVPDLELVTYEGASHWLHHEADDLNLRIDGFLEKIKPVMP